MLSLKKIVVPVDFSEASVGAARQAAVLARHFDSEITLVHALASPTYGVGTLDGGYIGISQELVRDQEGKRLDSFLDDELADLNLRRVLLEGDAARRIVQFADSEQSDLIVMSTRGYGVFRRFILGSVTAKVLHDANIRVWTGVHLEAMPQAPSLEIRNVLCALDLKPHSRQTLCWAARFAAEFGARLGIVHATAPLDLSGPGGRYLVPEWRSVMLNHAGEDIARLQEAVSTRAEVSVESGDAPKVIRMAAEDTQADVLVIGRSSEEGIAGRLRTNAYAIIRESPCPVVSV